MVAERSPGRRKRGVEGCGEGEYWQLARENKKKKTAKNKREEVARREKRRDRGREWWARREAGRVARLRGVAGGRMWALTS